MSRVRITLLGPPAVIVGDQTSPAKFCAVKPLALIAYLTLERRPHARDDLATLLWSESGQAAARASLRQALSQVRECLGDRIQSDRRTIELTGTLECDVHEFLEAVERDPAAAADYEVGRFLEGLAPRNAPVFDEWRDVRARSLVERYRAALQTLIRDARADSDWSSVVRWAGRWLVHEPLSEDAARAAMEGHYLGGSPAGALDVFTAYAARLRTETGADPAASFAALAERIGTARAGQPVRRRSSGSTLKGAGLRPHLVGRHKEWEQLVRTWDAVARGRGRAILLEGEQGAGKSRLADEFLQWAALRGAVVLRGTGYEARSGIPYAPIAMALREVVTAPGLGGTDPEWLTEVARLIPQLRQRFPTLPDPMAPASGTDRWRLFEAVAQVLVSIATDHPVVVALDDLQWCDAESCALLHFLANRMENTPVALLITVTPGDLQREVASWRLRRALRAEASSVVVGLAPLSIDDLTGLFTGDDGPHGAAAAADLAARIHAATDGNPFYVVELLKTLESQDLLAADPLAGTWRVSDAVTPAAGDRFTLPASVREAIAQRVDRLPYEMRDVVATVAVAGRAVGTDVLSSVHGISRLRAAALADGLVERMLLLQDGREYRCAHPVIADVVRDLLTPARRAETHRAIALAMEDLAAPAGVTEHAGEIARHAQLGNETAMAYRYALLASDEATQRYAFEEALTWVDLAAATAAGAEESREVDRRTHELLPLVGGQAQSPPDRTSGGARSPRRARPTPPRV